MKKTSVVLFVVAVIVFLGLVPSGDAASYSYSGPWQQSDRDNWNAIELTPGSCANVTFGIFDWENSGNSLEVLADGMYASQSVWVWEDSGSGTWYAGLSEGAMDLTLGDDGLFGFYFSDGTDTLYEYTISGSGNVWTLESTFCPTEGFLVNASDVMPVPLPANLILLGSGLLSLVSLSRRRA